MFHAVILAGGIGERFWPSSTRRRPKQLLTMLGSRSMLRESVDRISDLVPSSRIWIITSAALEEAVKDELPELDPARIVAEPVGRNTAPAVGLAAALASREDEDAVLAVMPSDHHFADASLFLEALETARAVAERERGYVTFGITPTRPETGYGYIESGSPLDTDAYPHRVCRVERFVEKPARDKAEEFLARGGYFWNSGIFVWRTDVLMEGFSKFLPDMMPGLEQVRTAPDAGLKQTIERFYSSVQSISIDNGLMEFVSPIFVVEGEFPWDDLGSWASLDRVLPSDGDGNVVTGSDPVVLCDTRDSIGVAEGGVGAVRGVSDLVVVSADGKTLICPKDKSQDVKQIVNRLRSMGDDGEKFL